jgi:hypothetical protein
LNAWYLGFATDKVTPQVPSPNEQNANDTTTCAKGCSQGTGSPEDTKKYGDCIQGCIAKYYYVSTEGTPKATGANNGSGSGSGSGSGADNTATGTGAAATNSGSDSTGSGTQTGTGAAPSKTNAAPGVGVGSSGALVGALAALLVL